MQVFKCALQIVRGNLIFPLIYIVGLSFMGVFMSMGFNFDAESDEFQMERGSYAVIDRDQSPLSQGIAESLAEFGEVVPVEDDDFAMQDAVAKGWVDYLLIVPEGFGDTFAQAARNGEELPTMDAVYSYYSMEGGFADAHVNDYLSMARGLFAMDKEASQGVVASDALERVTGGEEASIISNSKATSEADRFIFFLQWSTYSLFAGIVICIGILTSTLGRAEVRRRNLASPLSFVSYNAQLALSCIVLTVVAWAWTFCLGLVVFPAAVQAISPLGLLLCAISMLAFCLVPLAFGLLLGQLGANSIVCNAVGNIVGMVISFFSGAWISLDYLSSEIIAFAHWMPGYWYASACQFSAQVGEVYDWASLAPLAQCVGILLLFAVALFVVSILAGRLRLQTAQAGGNRAAEAV